MDCFDGCGCDDCEESACWETCDECGEFEGDCFCYDDDLDDGFEDDMAAYEAADAAAAQPIPQEELEFMGQQRMFARTELSPWSA